MVDILVDGELILYGTVGDGLWGDGFTARDVVSALAEVGRGNDVTVRLNSGGGFASEGAAIYNALSAHRGHKTVYVDGIAASAASLVAMAGDQIVMRRGSVMMIHDPAGFTMGSATDHEKSIESLNALANSFADIYAEKTGRTVEEARADMREEIWLTPEKAVERGYATNIIDAEALEPTMFAYHLYQHPPQPVMTVANSAKPPRSARKAASTAASPRQQENPMPDKPAVENTAITEHERRVTANIEADVERRIAEALMSHNARTEAILGCDEAKGRDDLAKFLAFNTSLDVDAARAALAKAPKPAEPVANPFDRAMMAAGNPQVGPDGQAIPDEPKPGAMAAAMRRHLNLAN